MERKQLFEKYPTYKDYKTQKQDAVNALPLHWAFSKTQFEELCDSLGATPDDFVSYIGGALVLKKDLDEVRSFFCQDDGLDTLMEDYGWALDAFYYEMGNHEYHINWQGDYDVINCFTDVEYVDAVSLNDYLDQTNWGEDTKRAYIDARTKFYKMADENDWY